MRNKERFSAQIDDVLRIIKKSPLTQAGEYLQRAELREFLKDDSWHLVAVIRAVPALAAELLEDEQLRGSIDSRYKVDAIIKAAPYTLFQLQQDERLRAFIENSTTTNSLLFAPKHFSDAPEEDAWMNLVHRT